MNQSKKNVILFILLVGLQIVVILGLFANRLYILSTGREVALMTLPVDPRDFIRGEYVDLRYEIGTVGKYYSDHSSSDFAQDDSYIIYDRDVSGGSKASVCTSCLQVGDTVYVTLTSYDNKIWRVGRVGRTQPTDFSLFIKGTVERVSGYEASIYYGIEKYFVEAGSGLALERSGSLLVYVAIGNDGSAVIKRVEPTKTQGLRGEVDSPFMPASDISSGRRDARRMADIQMIELGLELYYDGNNERYPEELSVLAPMYIPNVPSDPTGAPYFYELTSPQNYRLRALFEDSSNPALASDVIPGDIFFDVAP